MTFKREMKLFWAMIFGLWLSHFLLYNYIGPGALGLFFYPVLLAFALRTIFTPLFAYHFVLVVHVVLNLISETKYLFAQKVLNSQDFIFLSQATETHDFLPKTTLVLIVLSLASLLIPYKKFKLNLKYAPVAASLVIGLIVYSKSIGFMTAVNSFLDTYVDIGINRLNDHDNVKGNGILLHVTQTLPLGQKPPKGPHKFFENASTPATSKSSARNLSGYDIFLINWESAYFENDKNSVFHNDLARLTKLGYENTTMISPVYGGNTSEAEFELMTGLPAKGLPGVKFQLYGDSFAGKEASLANFTKGSGYEAYYYHNTPSVHWNRDVAVKNLHFDDLFFSDKMNVPPKISWVRDHYLYDNVVAKYENSIKSPQPVFNHLMNVYTHGAFTEENGDGGLANYNGKLSLSMDDYEKFEQQITEIANRNGRKVVFFVVGDHKPSMNKLFFTSKTLSKEYYQETDETAANAIFRFKDHQAPQGHMDIGRVPFFIKIVGKEQGKEAGIISPLRDKPLFCFPAYLASEIDISKSKFYTRLKDVCDQNTPITMADPQWQQNVFPPELFAEVLF